MKNIRNGILKPHYGWIILILGVAVVMGALGLARFGYTMILPEMKKGLQLSDSMAGDLATANLRGYLCMSVICGILAVRFNPKVIISASLVFISLAMALTGFSGGYPQALAGRILTGIGSAGANISMMGLVMAWFSVKRRGFATGITVSGSSFGLILTGLLIPYTIKYFGEQGWKASWFILAGIVMIIAIIGTAILKNKPSDLSLLPIGEITSRTEEDNVKTEHSPKFIQNITLWKIFIYYRVWYLSLIYLLFGFSYIIYSTFYARYLIWEGGMTVQKAGYYWSMVGLFSIISGLVWGTVSDKIGRKTTLAVVFALQGTCYLIFGIWRMPEGFILSSIIFAMTAWSIPAIMAAVTGDILGSAAPLALGLITFFFGIGQAAGPFIAGRVADYTHSYSAAFISAGCAAILGAILSVFISNEKTYRA